MARESVLDDVQSPPPLDPQCAAFLEAVGELPPFTPDVIAALRQRAEVPAEVLTLAGTRTVSSVEAPGWDGRPGVRLVVSAPPKVDAPVPVLVAIHGGGLIAGTAEEGVGLGYLVCEPDQQVVVVSPDYRLAPENRYPAALEDCVAALLWAAEHASELGGDPGRVVLVGASAGGGLAAATSLLNRDEQLVDVLGSMLLFPMLDDRNNSGSARQLAGQGIWRQADNEVGWASYLGPDAGTAEVSPYAAPARALDLSGLPPLYVDVASNETFRDEAVAFASGVWAAGGAAELHVWPGGFHGHSALNPGSRLADVEWAARRSWLARLLSQA
jgi:acetyl esterase/lipase